MPNPVMKLVAVPPLWVIPAFAGWMIYSRIPTRISIPIALTKSSIFGCGGGTCGSTAALGDTAPTVTVGTSGMTIPKQTPFVLSGSGNDADGDALSYSWEEHDLGKLMSVTGTTLNNKPSGNLGTVPLFRTLPPKPTAERYFPAYSVTLNNQTSKFEVLPNYARQLKFRLTARDNRGGATVSGVKTINVTDQAGPFTVTYPGSGATWPAGQNTGIVNWDVAKTDVAPVSCSAVDIALITETATYPLLKNTPNDGTEIVDIPSVASTAGRVKVSCSDNLFFALSKSDMTVTNAATTPDFTLQASYGAQAAGTSVGKVFCELPAAPENVALAVGSVANFANPVALSLVNLPAGFGGSLSVNPVYYPYSKTYRQTSPCRTPWLKMLMRSKSKPAPQQA